jgi:hypothetical protein
MGQIDPRMADAVEASARACSSDPNDWRVSYHDVPIDFIMTIESSKDGAAWELVGAYDHREATRGLRLMPAFSEELNAAVARATTANRSSTTGDRPAVTFPGEKGGGNVG